MKQSTGKQMTEAIRCDKKKGSRLITTSAQFILISIKLEPDFKLEYLL